jgi:hypothetical protein
MAIGATVVAVATAIRTTVIAAAIGASVVAPTPSIARLPSAVGFFLPWGRLKCPGLDTGYDSNQGSAGLICR